MNAQEWTELEIAGEEEDAEDELEEDEDDEDEEDGEDEDDDDDVGTDERGKEILKAPGDRDDPSAETSAEPDVSSDRRVPPAESAPGERPTKARNPPLPIKQIEDLEDDAPGG